MATILLSAAGAAVGSSIGGSVLGLSMTAVGRFAGAAIGRRIDQGIGQRMSQRVMGSGSELVEQGRVDRLRLTSSGEGQAIARVFGRMRVGGHVIWATEFLETVTETTQETQTGAGGNGGGGGGGGGKGSPRQTVSTTAGSSTTTVRNYSYSVSLALGLCEGEIALVTRVWADGAEIAMRDLNMRVYRGTMDQLPDPKIEAVEGAGNVPAYRGTAYVVLEDLDLTRFGNRVPQFSFEVVRPDLKPGSVTSRVRGVSMIPGSGEYALAPEPVYMDYAAGADQPFAFGGEGAAVANMNSPSQEADFKTAIRQLKGEAPNCGAVSLVVSWFGDDLRVGECSLRPKVEQKNNDGRDQPWSVAGLSRQAAQEVPRVAGRPVYGGTHSDKSVIDAIRHMNGQGLSVLYYPFILMDQLDGNTLPDPWSDNASQPALPWRGRITLSEAPGRDGSPDGTAQADAQVAAFFGTASAGHFSVSGDTVTYTGPDEWSYRRFILHQAALCAAAGSVEAFCIGTEMRSLTQIRGANGFPAVDGLIALAAECRALLGPSVKIGYAADWSEYFGYHPQDGSGNVYFHLDPLWADDTIDFIGIDNYMPMSDWRDGKDHKDVGWGSIYNRDYLMANIEGGEGYDWYYGSQDEREAQTRSEITDGAYDEPWVFRYKDIRNWWENYHHNRIGGVRQELPTGWVPGSKPIWFTEIGCAALDKGTNQPNKFLDPKSSESRLPHYSNGLRDELIQHQYLDAFYTYWGDSANNPASSRYNGQMIDLAHTYVWTWDARPYPWFPGNEALWSDGGNYRRGHWLNGRLSGRSLASVVEEICAYVGLTQIDTSELFGWVRGYVLADVGDARRALQPLMLRYAFDAIERDGKLVFRSRGGEVPTVLDAERLALSDELDGSLIETRAGEADMTGRVRVGFVLADADHQVTTEETVLPDERTHAVSETELPLLMTRSEGKQTVERWLSESRVSRDAMRFALPPSQLALGAGDIVQIPSDSGPVLARVDRVEVTDHQVIEAVRMEPDVYEPSDYTEQGAPLRPFVPAVPVSPFFMDLPLMRGDEVPHAPHLAVTSQPWPGPVAVYDAPADEDYRFNSLVASRSVMGVTETPLIGGRPGLIDRGAPLQIRLASGALQSISDGAFLSGGNAMAIGDGTADNWEIFQFRDAQLLSEDRWLVSHRLRGQAGSDAHLPPSWPIGSIVVRLDGTPQQIAMLSAQRGVARHYRIGPASRPYDDATFTHQVETFRGNGLRPYRPAHLTADQGPLGTTFRWVRRTRIDGDSWDGYDVPLGEEVEAYIARVIQDGQIVREVQVSTPEWTYEAGLQIIDGLSGAYSVTVAQISARFGPGPFVRADIAA